MKLKTNHNTAKEKICDLIISGNALLDSITEAYQGARKSGVFNQDTHIPPWTEEYHRWFATCLSSLQEIFPSAAEAIKFKNTQPSAMGQHGINIRFTGLTNNIKARLITLDVLLNSVDNYSTELTEELFIEDIDSFSNARDINPREVSKLIPLELLENQIQTAFEEIIGENFHQKDWGGETNDLFTSQIKISGRRIKAAFLLKGRGTKGKLTIAKCGHNGDQIVRLFDAPANLYIIQHVDEIDERVVRDLKEKIELRIKKGEACQMCIIDGTDTARILKAYGKL